MIYIEPQTGVNMTKSTLFDKMFLPNSDDISFTGSMADSDSNLEDIVHLSGDGTVRGVEEFEEHVPIDDDEYFEEIALGKGPITQEDYEHTMWSDDMLVNGDESTYGYDEYDYGNPVG